MRYIVYTSTATYPFAEADLKQMLGHWRETNARLDITGVLLYSEGNIMQVLEGPAESIQGLFGTIAADVRHRTVVKLGDGPLQARTFSDWSMRFRSVDMADFNEFVGRLNQAPNQANSLTPLLEAFMTSEAW
jgi:hypothetical protein